jgi:hypothetical protein
VREKNEKGQPEQAQYLRAGLEIGTILGISVDKAFKKLTIISPTTITSLGKSFLIRSHPFCRYWRFL